ncbi:MAG TPA: hypothetical protein P5307_28535, partial [Pirellulaceae bacterium]|nr:hypothetical protein [Pirellulaceae bacterium]
AAVTRINADANNGVVNAIITPATNSTAPILAQQGEGEASATVAQPITSVNRVQSLVPVAEGESQSAELAQSTPSLTSQSSVVLQAEGESSVAVAACSIFDDVDSRPTISAIAAMSPRIDVQTLILNTSSTSSNPAKSLDSTTTPADSVWSNYLTSDRFVAFEAEDENFCRLGDNVLAIDEAFADADNW